MNLQYWCLAALLLAPAPAIDESFSGDMRNWWSEGGTRVWVEDGKLNVDADPAPGKTGAMATVWNRKPQPADFQLDLEAHVISSTPGVNNINLFFDYTDPAGGLLESSRGSRVDAEYAKYHKLSGYIITFVNDPQGEGKARIRIRRNPGFELLAETFAYHCRRGVTYHLTVIKQGGDINFAIDGHPVLRAHDPKPLGGGYFGLRTYRTLLWWDNIRLRPL